MRFYFILALTFLSSHCLASVLDSDASDRFDFRTPSSQESDGDFIESGYYVKTSALERHYVTTRRVRSLFHSHNQFRQSIDPFPDEAFDEVTQRILAFISSSDSGMTEEINQISNLDLSRKIMRLSFCFNTDPYMTAAKIYVESRYQRTAVSPTGAVGLTQLTGVAIDEINDQLGNRGRDNALEKNGQYLRQAIDCYLGSPGRWVDMWDDGVIQKGQIVRGHAKRLKRAKNWVVSDIDRDLLYGQALLKIKLAVHAEPDMTLLNIYRMAFRAYNAEEGDRKDIYAENVIRIFRKMLAIDIASGESLNDLLALDSNQR